MVSLPETSDGDCVQVAVEAAELVEQAQPQSVAVVGHLPLTAAQLTGALKLL